MIPHAHSPAPSHATPRRPRRATGGAPPALRLAFAGGLQRPKAATAAGVAFPSTREIRA